MSNCRWEAGYIASKGTQGIAPPERLSLRCLLQKMTGHSLLFGFLFAVAFYLFAFFICNTELLSYPPTHLPLLLWELIWKPCYYTHCCHIVKDKRWLVIVNWTQTSVIWGVASTGLACRHVCVGVSWLMIVVGESTPLWIILSLDGDSEVHKKSWASHKKQVMECPHGLCISSCLQFLLEVFKS